MPQPRGSQEGILLQAREVLWDFLEDLVPSNTNNSGRGKTLTVLTRIWLAEPDDVQPLRDIALKCLASANGENRLAVHWPWSLLDIPSFSMWPPMSEHFWRCMAKAIDRRQSAVGAHNPACAQIHGSVGGAEAGIGEGIARGRTKSLSRFQRRSLGYLCMVSC
jgi:hypothetical protein